MKKDEILNRIGHSVHLKDPQAEVFLFGSRARGNNKPDSDWDILILVDNNQITNEIEDKFRSELYNIELECEQIISTFIYPKEYWNATLSYSPLYKSITTEGIRL